MTTTLIVISCLIIGAIGGAWWQSTRDVDYRSLHNTIQDLEYDLGCSEKAYKKASQHYLDMLGSRDMLQKENEALKFQIQQYNAGMDQMKFTDQG